MSNIERQTSNPLFRALYRTPMNALDERHEAAIAAEDYALDRARESAERSPLERNAHDLALGL